MNGGLAAVFFKITLLVESEDSQKTFNGARTLGGGSHRPKTDLVAVREVVRLEDDLVVGRIADGG